MIHSTPIFLAIRSCREDVGLRLLFNWSNWIKPSGWKAICGSQDQNFKRWIFGSVLVDNMMVRLRKHIPVIGLPDQKNAWIEYVWDLPPLKGLLLRKNVDDSHIAVRSQSKFIDPCASPLVTKWTPMTAGEALPSTSTNFCEPTTISYSVWGTFLYIQTPKSGGLYYHHVCHFLVAAAYIFPGTCILMRRFWSLSWFRRLSW